MRSEDGHRRLGWTFRLLIDAAIAIAGVAVVFGIALLAIPDDVMQEIGPLLGIVLLALMLLVLLIAAGAAYRACRWPTLMMLSMALVTLGAIGLIALIWLRPSLESASIDLVRRQFEMLVLCASTMLIIGGALAHNGVLQLVPARSFTVRSLVVVTCACAWMFALLLIGFIWLADAAAGGMRFMSMLMITYFALALLAFLSVAGTVLTPVVALSNANRRVRGDASIIDRPSIDMTCPRCGERQAFRAGLVRCRRCHARLRIEVEEPRCDCGYVLYQLTGEKCPECGRAIPERLRWRGETPAAAGEGRVSTTVDDATASTSVNE